MPTLCTFWAFGPHCMETISCAWTKRMRVIRQLLQRVISSHWRADFDRPKNGHASPISAATSTPFYCINWPCLPFTKARYRWKTSTVSPARRELTVICGPAQHSMDSKLILPVGINETPHHQRSVQTPWIVRDASNHIKSTFFRLALSGSYCFVMVHSMPTPPSP
jgi:hypothetical protein